MKTTNTINTVLMAVTLALTGCGGTDSSSSSSTSSSSSSSSSTSSSSTSSSSSSTSSSSSSSSSSSTSSSSSSSGNTTAGVIYKGVSLAGAEFGDKKFPGIYETDYIYPSQSSVDYFKSKKMNTLRLPFLWERLQPTLNQAFDATEFARLDLFVTETTAKGITVVIDPHNYARYRGNLIGSSQVPISAFANFWTRLANAYKNNDKVIFALMNEPNTMKTEDWLTAANAGAKAVRDAGANNLILVPGNGWTGAHSWTQNYYGTPNSQVMVNFVDPKNNFAFEFHQYFDADFSGTKAECATSEGDTKLADATAWLKANNYRGFLGEFGGGNNAACQATIGRVLQYLETNKQWIGWTWWAAGPWWGNYFMSIERTTSGADVAQMSWLTPFLK